jgi:hypothetical protein
MSEIEVPDIKGYSQVHTDLKVPELCSSGEKLTMDFACPLLVWISFQGKKKKKVVWRGRRLMGKGEAKGGFRWTSGPSRHLFSSILQGSGLMCHLMSHLLLE